MLATACLAAEPAPNALFQIEVVDSSNGWPVPLVSLETTHHITYISDNAGLIAVDAPELFGREVFFHVASDGYEVSRDGFGYRGVRLRMESGGSAKIEVKRTMLAKRLGRLTGAGQFAHAQKLGQHLDWNETGVFGCDSVLSTEHRGKRFWLWGDTTLPHYPLGIFHSSSATTSLQPLDSMTPPVQLRYQYFRDDNARPRGVAQLPGDGPTWLSGYVSLPDQSGESRLVATYSKIKPPLEAYEKGLCVWNEDSEQFEVHRVLWQAAAGTPSLDLLPEGHPAFWDDADGKRWLLFGDPLPTLRCEPNFESWQDSTKWQRLSPQRTIAAKTSDESITPHRGSIAWNAWRKRWVTIFTQKFGKPSALGEIWYAEADIPTGPWENAIKVLSHNRYTFYNPRIHAELTDPKTPILLFEGTYTKEFSGNEHATPRYDYNQILYRLDLDEL
jgi:hypothetical protein